MPCRRIFLSPEVAVLADMGFPDQKIQGTRLKHSIPQTTYSSFFIYLPSCFFFMFFFGCFQFLHFFQWIPKHRPSFIGVVPSRWRRSSRPPKGPNRLWLRSPVAAPQEAVESKT